MRKIHAATVALLLGAAAALGILAATRTTSLGRTAVARPVATRAAIAARAHRLDRIEAALRRSLRSRAPKLPAVPVVRHVASPPPVAAVASSPQRLVYQRPAPIVIVKHRAHGDDHETGHGADGGTGGGDG